MKRHGFTIVELLIVIVVIAILASISVVAYNGIQSRSQISKTKQELALYQKLVEMYKIDNGTYPVSLSGGSQWDRQTAATQNTFIIGLVPTYAASLPFISDGSGQYLYRSAGTTYKFIKYRSGGLPASEWGAVPDDMKDQNSGLQDRYGVWSSGGNNL